ncbi:MAG: hypothetical protein ACE5KA_00090 [Nitrososphaerales archaeon]
MISMFIKDFDEPRAQEQADDQSKHILLLYDDEESLTNVLGASEELTNKNWFRTYCGTQSHSGFNFLRKHGWSDVTISPYGRLVDDTKQYFREVWDRIMGQAGDLRTCVMGFMTGDLCHKSSLRNAITVEELYNSNRINGIMYCPYLLKDLLRGGVGDVLDLIKSHDQSFLVQKDKLYKIG